MQQSQNTFPLRINVRAGWRLPDLACMKAEHVQMRLLPMLPSRGSAENEKIIWLQENHQCPPGSCCVWTAAVPPGNQHRPDEAHAHDRQVYVGARHCMMRAGPRGPGDARTGTRSVYKQWCGGVGALSQRVDTGTTHVRGKRGCGVVFGLRKGWALTAVSSAQGRWAHIPHIKLARPTTTAATRNTTSLWR